MRNTAIALTIAGSDSGGGAGIQADLKAFSALGVYGASVLTAVTAQNTRAVSAIHELPGAVVAAQIEAVLDDLAVGAIKLGMLFSPQLINVVAEALQGVSQPLIVDPVMVAKSGDTLLQETAVAALIAKIVPMASVLTPNLPEAARLLKQPEADGRDAMEVQARALLSMGPRAVLLKGGHGRGAECCDLLVTRDAEPLWLVAPRHETTNTHGTGCTYSSAITAELAKGASLGDAVRTAHAYLQAAIRAADGLRVGSGHGPVHHFHALWTPA